MIKLNTYYHEHCWDTLDKMENDSLDLVLCSPPYYNARDYSKWSDLESYYEDMHITFEDVLKKLKPSRMCIINISPIIIPRTSRNTSSKRIPLPFHFNNIMEGLGYEFLEDIIWKKPDGAAPNRNGGFSRHRKPVAYKPNIVTEYILVYKKPSKFLIDKILKNDSLVEDGYERTNVWEFNPETKSKHPAPYPEELAERCIKYYSYENDVVYDPFGGSGTTGIVASRLNRNWIMSEIHEEYVNMFKERHRNIIINKINER